LNNYEAKRKAAHHFLIAAALSDYITSLSKQAIFNYEFMEFYLSEENPAFTYKTDFLLPQIAYNGRKVLLEPPGIRSGLTEFLAKLAIFRKHCGKYFCLILIVPDQYVEIIERYDRKHAAFDFSLETL
jgi:hypothetical protein